MSALESVLVTSMEVLDDRAASTSQCQSPDNEYKVDHTALPSPRKSCSDASVMDSFRKDTQLCGQSCSGKKGRRFVITTEVIEQNVVALQACCALLVVVCAALVLFSIVYFGFNVGRPQNDTGRPFGGFGIGDVSVQKMQTCSSLLNIVQSTANVVTLYPDRADGTSVTKRRSKLLEQDARRGLESFYGRTVNDAGGADALLKFDVWASYRQTDSQNTTIYNTTRTYTAAGQELLVMNTLDPTIMANTSQGSIIERIPLFTGGMSLAVSMEYSGSKSPPKLDPVPYGVSKTFRAQQVSVSHSDKVLMVIGTAISGAPVTATDSNPDANSPQTLPWFMGDASSVNLVQEYFHSRDIRLFRSTAVLFFDITDPDSPAPLGTLEFEGHLTSLQLADDSHAYFFIDQALHLPYGAKVGSLEASDVMPVYRFTAAHQAEDPSAWTLVGECTSVQGIQFTSGSLTFGPESRLLSIFALPLSGADLGKPNSDDGIQSFVVAWDPEVPGLASSPYQAYLAQSISGPVSAFTPSSQPSAYTDVATAVVGFELSGGSVSYTGVAVQVGEMPFSDAVALDASGAKLLLLTTVKYDSATIDSSVFSLYDTNLTLLANQTDLMPEERPTRASFSDILYSSDLGDKRHVFISVATSDGKQVVYVMEIAPELTGSSMMQLSGRLYVDESVQLMSTVESKAGEELLLVAGSTTDSGLQISLYNTTLPQGTVTPVARVVAADALPVLSEALHDIRALLVAKTDSDIVLGLPVSIAPPDASGCSAAALNDRAPLLSGMTHGAYFWRLSWNYTTPKPTMSVVSAGFISHIPPAVGAPLMFKNGCSGEICYAAVIKRIKLVDSPRSGQGLLAVSSGTVSLTSWDELEPINATAGIAMVTPLKSESLFVSLPVGTVPPQTSPIADGLCRAQGACCVAA